MYLYAGTPPFLTLDINLRVVQLRNYSYCRQSNPYALRT